MLLLLLLMVLWLFDMIAIRRHVDIRLSRPLLALLVLVGIVLAAFAVGQLSWFPLARSAPYGRRSAVS